MLSLEFKQLFWFLNQNVQDPDTWTLSHLFQLKSENEKIVGQYLCVVQKSETVQDW